MTVKKNTIKKERDGVYNLLRPTFFAEFSEIPKTNNQ